MRSPVLLALVWLASAVDGRAEEPKKLVGTKKPKAPKLDLTLPKLEQLPTEEGLRKPPPQPEMSESSQHEVNEPYTLVAVTHAKSFAGTPQGLKPTAGELAQVAVDGRPLTTEPFTTVVRVRSPSRRSSLVEVQILDPRESTVMSASGQLVFKNGDEAEWAVDWAPTAVRSAGAFQVQVRVGGLLVGTRSLAVTAAASR